MFPQTAIVAIEAPAKAEPPPLKRGPITDDEKKEIERLFDSMRNPTAAAIARRMNRLKNTIAWHMTSQGMRKKHLQFKKSPVSYTAAQDKFIEALRVDGKPYREIAELATEKFGIKRELWSIRIRLALLAAAAGVEDGE